MKVYKMTEKRREYEREYKLKHAERLREYHREYRLTNPEKVRESQRKYYLENAEKLRGYQRKYRHRSLEKIRERLYGLSPGAYDALALSQGGLCAICQKAPNGRVLDVDHDHETGQVRGLLCWHCNVGIGHLQDNPYLLAAAITYLEHANQKNTTYPSVRQFPALVEVA